MSTQTITQITLQQYVALDSTPVTASKYPKYTVQLGFSISNITASELGAAITDAQNSAAAAKTSETNAKASETKAKTSETNAKTSETNSKTSETAANASKVAAATSQAAALASQNAAKTSETNSKTSETNSKASETAANASKVAAATSEAAALASKNAAATSETNAKTSETNSKTSETNSKASETAANASKVAAAASQTAAAASQTAAKTSETNAKTSETNSKTSETNAKASETAAIASKNAAATSETNAKTSETNAKNSETAALASKNAAATSETNAKTSETNSKTSETNAKASEVAAKASADSAAASVAGAYLDKGSLTVDLNTLGAYANFGIYYQTNNTGATTANNYPEAKAGTLIVTKGPYNGAVQTYIPFDSGQIYVRALSGTWNGTNGPWAVWKNIGSTANQANQTDANALPGNGLWYLASTASNLPRATSGIIYQYSKPGGSNILIQQYRGRSSDGTIQIFERSGVNDASLVNTWDPWTEVWTSQKVVPVANGGTGTALTDGTAAINIGAVPSRGVPTGVTDINDMGPTSAYIGVWNFAAGAQFNLPNVPEVQAGELEVTATGAFNGMQRYTSRYGSIWVRTLTASWNATTKPWGDWRSVGHNFARKDGLDLNTIAYSATFYGNGLINGPAGVGTAFCFIQVDAAINTPVIQTVTASTANRVYRRSLASGNWSPWMEIANTGDISPTNLVRNARLLSNNYLPVSTTPATGVLEFVASTDSRVPANSLVGNVGLWTKTATGVLHQVNFGTNDDTNSNWIGVTPGDILDVSMMVAATGITDAAQVRLVLVTRKGTTAVANRRIAQYDALTGWTMLQNSYIVPATEDNVQLGIWSETTAPANSVVCFAEPTIIKRTPQWLAYRSASVSGTIDLNTWYNPDEAFLNAISNGPAGAPTTNWICTVKAVNTSAGGTLVSTQEITHRDTNAQWSRNYINGTWSDWVKELVVDTSGKATDLVSTAGALGLGADGSNPLDATSLRQMQAAIANVSASGGINGVMSTFIGDVSWWHGDPSQLPTGYTAPSGQLLLRSDYPEIWTLISSGVFKSVTDSAWNSTVGNRGMFSTGTVTSGTSANFRMPDYNGAVSGTPAGVFLRGAQSGMLPGEIRSSALPNITGEFFNVNWGNVSLTGNSKSFYIDTLDTGQSLGTTPSGGDKADLIKFSAARSSSLYSDSVSEVRPASVSGTWIMRMKGTFSAQTSFNVMISVASNPANSTTTEGGAVRSVLNGPSGELTGVTMKARHTVDASGVVSKRLVLGVSGGTGEVRIAEDGTVGIDGSLASKDFNANGNITLSTAAQRRALVTHLGFTGAVNRLVVPISSTQAVQIISATTIGNQNSSGDSTVTFPYAFASINSVILSNGDAAVGSLTMGVLNAMRVGGFDVRIYNGSNPQVGATRINYIAMGLINI